MDEANNCAMDVNGDDVSEDKNATNQQTQASEQDERVNLSKFPKELLELILIHLDAKQLLAASHVCRSFAAAAASAFAQKYSKKVYGFHKGQKSFDKVVVTKYGDKMRKILVPYGDTELLHLIEQNCCSLKSATFVYFETLPRLKGLKKANVWQIGFSGDGISNKNMFAEFINNNPELETLSIGPVDNTLLESMVERLDVLKDLQLVRVRYVKDLPRIDLKSLETLEIDDLDAKCFSRILQAMNCNAIKTLSVQSFPGYSEGNIQDICSIKTLISLRLHECGHWITESQLRKLAIELPHLIDLNIEMKINDSGFVEHIHSVLSILPKLTKLTIKLDYDDWTRLSNDLKEAVFEFHAHFARINTEIEIECGNCTLFISKEYIVNSDSDEELGTALFELYWMSNLNERSVRAVIEKFWMDPTEVKFVNYSGGHSFDISVLLYLKLQRTWTLDITSNGPITVNANATRYPGFFPKLDALKIQLDNNSAIDFLHNLDKRVCKNIETLWLNTKGIPVNQEADMMSILSKFENLESLHINLASAKFDAEHLFSVCTKLKDLQIRRQW